MKRLLLIILGIALCILCAGCSDTETGMETGQALSETDPPAQISPCTEVQETIHTHSFGPWEYSGNRMQRSCGECSQTQLRDLTDEEQFWFSLKGHWQLHEVTFMGEAQEVYYIRDGVWHYYVDYDEGDTLTYTSALDNMDPADFMRTLTVQYSHFDALGNVHYAAATSPEGHHFQLLLETGHSEPLLRVIPELGADVFDEMVFSQYRQVAPVAVGTWSGINGGKITYITLNEDLTFTSNIETFPSGTWQLAPGGGLGVGSVQLFYTDENGRHVSDLGYFDDELSYIPDVEADMPDLEMVLNAPRSNDMWCLRKLQPELLQPLMDKGSGMIVGTWDSKSIRSFAGEDTATHIQTGYTLTVNDDGTFTMMADKQVNGTWVTDGSSTSGGNVYYNYLFTYPGSAKSGERIALYPNSGELSFCYKAEKVKYVNFVQYNENQWAAFLEGPNLLPGSYVSGKIVWYDKNTGDPREEIQTDYTLTIGEDGTVMGMLHKPVSGTWFYDDLLTEGGHSYIFRMDHTPPEQVSTRKDDGMLIFDTKIDGEHAVIYFYPE